MGKKYEAWEFHRGIVVFVMPERAVEEDGFATLTDAQDYADLLNLWYDGKPTPTSSRVFMPNGQRREPHEAELMNTLERMLIPERMVDQLAQDVRELVRQHNQS